MYFFIAFKSQILFFVLKNNKYYYLRDNQITNSNEIFSEFN